MKLLSKFALLLVLAGVLAIVLSFTGLAPRGIRLSPQASPTDRNGPAEVIAQPKPNVRTVPNSNEIPSALSDQGARSHVRVPAIRGENNYGWVQLPRGTSVELVQQSAGNLIVRWDGIMVKIPQTAANSGAIALRQSSRLAAGN